MKRGLERKLLAYFLLIVIAALMIGVEFTFEMSRSDLKEEIWQNISAAKTNASDESVHKQDVDPLAKLRTKVVVMFGVLTLVVAIVLLMFVRNITMPLQRMVDAANHINEGDLSQVIEIETDNEIGQLGTAINELTSNLQEVSALTHSSCKHMLETLDSIRRSCGNSKEISLAHAGQFDRLEKELNSLKNFSGEFELLETDLNNLD
ncbi:MAG: HAMP domain-containing protein [Deltaproteobacteria bacterium]|nr:HAMP domain-containing protein [Deltaproteobacteria bacterium]